MQEKNNVNSKKANAVMYPAYSKVNFINIFNNTDKIYSTALMEFAGLQLLRLRSQ
ncbi:hypothetical protein [Candidatus Tisiphia endosymbiont of Thecophora atra]|jgi:hypothetical protein|uniref:hypothetical protein n=1 Tax=Candidatus Tisiphia endosymbiont of Thecophora atra TaxID=3066258 RepID=UPI00281908CA|nr:hypothetical protein [Rickettsia sp.]